jgi:polyisoprenoid-binding protein YceI
MPHSDGIQARHDTKEVMKSEYKTLHHIQERKGEQTMKKILRAFRAVAAIIAIVVPAAASAATWSIDPDHSTVGFKVKHMMVSNVKGEFSKYTGTVEIDDKDITKSKVDVSIETASINTGVAKRDDHLRSADFFDSAKYPTMRFVSKDIRKAGNKLSVVGDLSLRGVTREVVLDVEGPTEAVKDPWGATRRGAVATSKVNRKDFGLTWNAAIETGGVVVGDEVTINLDLELVRK